MLSVQQFSQKIKDKYPAYKNMPDDQLAQHMLEKYPQYAHNVDMTGLPQNPEDKVTGLPKTLLNISQGGADFLRSIGLGGISDLTALSGGAQAVQRATGINPVMTTQERQKLKSPQDVGMQGLQDVAGAASFAVPLGKGALAARAIYGALQGVLQGESQKGATPGSVRTSALIGAGANAVLPPVLSKFSEGLGKYAFGKGGEVLPQVMEKVGPIVGSAEQLAGKAGQSGKLFTQTQPIRDEFTSLLEKSKGGVAYKDIVNKAESLVKDLGFESQPAATAYIKTIKKNIDSITRDYLMNTKGMTFKQAGEVLNKDNYQIPLPAAQKILEGIRGDIKPSTWLSSLLGTTSDATQEFKRTLSSNIRGMIKTASGDPAQYDKLQAMKQGLAKISQNLRGDMESKGMRKTFGTLLNLGIAPELIASLLGGGALAPAGITAAALTGLKNPRVASGIIGHQNEIEALLQRLGIAGFGGPTNR